MGNGLNRLVRLSREKYSCSDTAQRDVFVTELVRQTDGHTLDYVIADCAPTFYRHLQDVANALMVDGGFLTTIKETLQRLPTSESFRESHFGEIAAGMFAEEFLGLKIIYSKLSLLTAENANAYKMDLMLYRPASNPLEFVLGEVKSSPKGKADGLPARHDQSCFAAVFRSLRGYGVDDLQFDLATVKDRLKHMDTTSASQIREALKPYLDRKVTYAGFALIDTATRSEAEMKVLATRVSEKSFDVDLVCIEAYKEVADSVYQRLAQINDLCS